MVLQDCTSSENILVGLYVETYSTSHESNQVINVKSEAVSDAEEEEEVPVPITFSELKAEPEVSCMCTVRQITRMCRSATRLFHLHICVCM